MNNNKEKKEEIVKELETVKDMKVLAESYGGKALLKALTSDIISSIESIVENRDTYTIQQFTSAACDIKTKLDVVRSLTRAKKNEEFLQNILAEALQE